MMKILLASASPRRSHILKEAGFDFEVLKIDVDESFPSEMPVQEIPVYLAKKKMAEAKNYLNDQNIIITADTVVILGDEIINKPADADDAFKMLEKLAGNTHTVISGVCISTHKEDFVFEDRTDVVFDDMSAEEIKFYIDNYQPFDKAGSYAIQEWIGLNKIAKIDGNYFNVVGFPMSKVYPILRKLLAASH